MGFFRRYLTGLAVFFVLYLVGFLRDDGLIPGTFQLSYLNNMEVVYVRVDMLNTLKSMDEALEREGYGKVSVSNTKRYYEYAPITPHQMPATQGYFAYSSEDKIPVSTNYQPMTVGQFLRTAQSDPKAGAIVVDGWMVIPRERFSESLEYMQNTLHRNDPDLPVSVSVVTEGPHEEQTAPDLG